MYTSYLSLNVYFGICFYVSVYVYCRAGKEGWSLQDLLADFHLLLFLCDFLDLQYDIPQLCRSIMQRDLPLDDGYQLIIRSVAGIDM